MKLWISETAWHNLRKLSEAQCGLKHRAKYIEWLAANIEHLDFIDNRPPYLKEWYDDNIQRPVWTVPGDKRPRTLLISDKAVRLLDTLSQTFNITNAFRLTDYSCRAVVVEALGMQYLLPREKTNDGTLHKLRIPVDTL